MIDTSVLIAIIAGAFALATLAVQTWGAIQLAKINAGQKEQKAAIADVHKVVNSAQTAMLETIKKLTAENSVLLGANAEREKGEVKAAGLVAQTDALAAARKAGQDDKKA